MTAAEADGGAAVAPVSNPLFVFYFSPAPGEQIWEKEPKRQFFFFVKPKRVRRKPACALPFLTDGNVKSVTIFKKKKKKKDKAQALVRLTFFSIICD